MVLTTLSWWSVDALFFCSSKLSHRHTRGGGCLHRQTTHTLTSPSVRGRRRPPVLPSLKATTPGLDHRHGSGEALTPCAVSFPRAGAQFPPTEPAACLLPALSACEKSDAVIAPCAADREPLSPPAPPPGSSLAGCRGGSADVEPATQRSSAVGKHRRRRWNVFPVTSRTSSALRAPSSPPLATPKVRVGRRWGLVTGCELPTLSVWHECSGCSWHTQDQQGYMCAEVRDWSSLLGCLLTTHCRFVTVHEVVGAILIPQGWGRC